MPTDWRTYSSRSRAPCGRRCERRDHARCESSGHPVWEVHGWCDGGRAARCHHRDRSGGRGPTSSTRCFAAREVIRAAASGARPPPSRQGLRWIGPDSDRSTDTSWARVIHRWYCSTRARCTRWLGCSAARTGRPQRWWSDRVERWAPGSERSSCSTQPTRSSGPHRGTHQTPHAPGDRLVTSPFGRSGVSARRSNAPSPASRTPVSPFID